MTTQKNNTMWRMAVVGAMLMAAVSMGGCYDYGLGGLIGLGNLLGSAGDWNTGGWNTGGWDTGGWDTGGTYWPDTSLYDPTADIQSVIDYRQDVMDASNDGWDDYIRQ
jgi:hypothetical protein